MKIIAINGSHRKGKNTATLLGLVLQGAKELGAETELLDVVDYNIKPCLGCNKCLMEPKCSIEDDGMTKLAAKMLEADGIVLGSPSYFANVTGLMKIFMDRTRWLYLSRNMLYGKAGAAVVHAALRNGGQELVQLILERFMLAHGMIIVGSRDPEGQIYNNGVTGTLFDHMEGDNKVGWKRSVNEDTLAARGCRQLGSNIVRYIEASRGKVKL